MVSLLGALRKIVAAMCLMALLGCNDVDLHTAYACTLVGCSHMLTICVLDSRGEEEPCFSGQVTTRDGDLTVGCCHGRPSSDDHSCWGTCVQIRTVPSDKVEVRLSSVTAWWKGTIIPDYQIFRPNGPRCRPACWQASTTIQLRP